MLIESPDWCRSRKVYFKHVVNEIAFQRWHIYAWNMADILRIFPNIFLEYELLHFNWHITEDFFLRVKLTITQHCCIEKRGAEEAANNSQIILSCSLKLYSVTKLQWVDIGYIREANMIIYCYLYHYQTRFWYKLNRACFSKLIWNLPVIASKKNAYDNNACHFISPSMN